MQRTSIALIAATAVVAGAGTAEAAHRFIITSSRQIKPGAIALRNINPKARAALHGLRGAPGPRGAQGAQGPAGVQATATEAFRNAIQPFTTTGATVATLSGLQPGAYIISAHTTLAYASGVFTPTLITCQLTAGADGDAAQAEFTSTPQRATVPLQLTHTFATTGSVTLRCAITNTSAATYTAAVTKIVAERVGIETHTAVSG